MPAEIYNRMLDVIEHVGELRMAGRGRVPVGGRDRGLVLVKNASGYDCGRFAVLGIDGIAAVSDPATSAIAFQNEHVISGKTPASSHAGKFVVLAEAVRSGAVGWGVASGVVPCKVDLTYSGQPYADVAAGDRGKLAAGEGGAAQVLWHAGTAGEQWAVVRLGAPTYPKLVGKLDGDLAAGSSATMSIWEGNTLTDSGRNITVYDWFLPTGKKLASGAKVAAFWASGKWYVDTTDTCPS
jgi:hypothetical protein